VTDETPKFAELQIVNMSNARPILVTNCTASEILQCPLTKCCAADLG